ERQAAVRGVEPGHKPLRSNSLRKSLRPAVFGATAALVFASTVWVTQAEQGAPASGQGQVQPQGGQGGQAQGRGRGGRQAGPAEPTPRLADGTVNFGRVPGEKGTWNVPYITNMAMRVVGPDGELLP